MLEQAGKDSLGHPPDHRVIEPVGRELAALAPDLEPDGVIGVGMEQKVEGDPARGRDLGVERECRAGGRERRRRGGRRSGGSDGVRGTTSSRLPSRCSGRRSRPTSSAVSRTAVVTRSGSAGSCRPPGSAMCPDQGSPACSARRIRRTAVGVGSEDDRDRRPDERIAPLVHPRAVDGEAIAKPT